MRFLKYYALTFGSISAIIWFVACFVHGKIYTINDILYNGDGTPDTESRYWVVVFTIICILIAGSIMEVEDDNRKIEKIKREKDDEEQTC
jgi:hypothetical protein